MNREKNVRKTEELQSKFKKQVFPEALEEVRAISERSSEYEALPNQISN